MKTSQLLGWIVLGCLWLPPNNGAGSPNNEAPPPADERQVLIPAGPYEMGSRRSLRELDPTSLFQSDRHMLGPEDPAHEVVLDAFTIDKYEVTHLEYQNFMNATGYKTFPRFWDHPDFNHPEQPVVGVTWKEAQQFCRWRNQRGSAPAVRPQVGGVQGSGTPPHCLVGARGTPVRSILSTG